MNKFIVLNVCIRWRSQVILNVDDVILSSRIAPNSLNNNNTVYAFDPLIIPFLSHTEKETRNIACGWPRFVKSLDNRTQHR